MSVLRAQSRCDGTRWPTKGVSERGELTAAFQPYTVESVAGTIDVLLQRTLKAEHTVEIVLLEFVFNALGNCQGRWAREVLT